MVESVVNDGQSDDNVYNLQNGEPSARNAMNGLPNQSKPLDHGVLSDKLALQTTCEMDAKASEVCKIAQAIVKKHTLASLSLGLVPIPLVDITALTVAQGNMLRSLANHYEQPFSDLHIKSLITTTLGSALPVLGSMGVSSMAKSIPGLGSLMGSASVSVLSGAMTYAIGQVFIAHFSVGGTMDDLDSLKVQQLFQQELVSGKRFAQQLINEQATLLANQTK
ncbi:MAG: YcjF family protein [bacterium]